MKKYLKKFSLVLAVLLTVSTTKVFAMTPTLTNDAKFTRGVSNCCYYVGSTATGYTDQINSAASNWEVTGYGWNPIYMTAVSSNSLTHMDFYGRTSSTDSYINSSIIAYTSYWNYDATLVAAKGSGATYDYYYTEIKFNLDLSSSYDYRVAKHEMGHAFGLAHTENDYSIMFPTLSGMMVSTVQQDDHDTINYLYN